MDQHKLSQLTRSVSFAGSTFMLPKQALQTSFYALGSPEEVDIIDPFAMSNTPSPSGGLLFHSPFAQEPF